MLVRTGSPAKPAARYRNWGWGIFIFFPLGWQPIGAWAHAVRKPESFSLDRAKPADCGNPRGAMWKSSLRASYNSGYNALPVHSFERNVVMESVISDLLTRFEKGSLSRRELLSGLAMLAGSATTAAAQDD